MDRHAYRLANALVGNPPDAAALEVTLLGPELRFESRARVAVTGADLNGSLDERAADMNTAHDVGDGTVLRFGERRSGTRAYVAVDGGMDVPTVLGSRSTHVLSRLGGIAGRSLRAGDRLPLGASQPGGEPFMIAPHTAVARHVHGGARVRVLRGPQDYYFGESTFAWLVRTRFAVSSRSDRMGYRLVPADSQRSPPSASGVADGSMISDATFVGAIQIPPSGEPIVLMADRQTTGGYPQIATIITADLPVAGQLAPGDWIEFTACSREEALAALQEQDEAFRAR
jgi:antagonist of KipI